MTAASGAAAEPRLPTGVVPSAGDRPADHTWRELVAVAAAHRLVRAGLVALVELTLCLVRLRDVYDIFIDEVTYTRIGASLAQGDGLALDGQPFNLHPPAVLGLLGAAIKLFGLNGDLEHQLLALRPLIAVFGALACAGTYLLVDRAAGQRSALAAAALLGLSPFVVLYNSEVMLEAPAQAATVALFGFLAASLWAGSTRQRRWCLGSAGLFGAITVCSKETFGLVVAVVLLVLLATGWVLPRRQMAMVLSMTATGYAIYVVAVGWAMGFGPWWEAKYGGALRLIGADQQTGFNSPTAQVSFLSRVVANAASNGVTYALLALGSLATVALGWRFRPWLPAWGSDATPRERVSLLVAVWGLTASGYLAYAVAFGTLEAQMFYIMIFPAAAAVCVWVSWAYASWPRTGQRACVAVLFVALLAQSGTWVAVHTGPTGSYQQFLAWAPTHLPPGSVISVTEDTGQFLIQGAVLGDWHTLADLKAHRVDYVLLSTVLVDQGYGTATTSFQAVLDDHAPLLFQSTPSGGGTLRLYCVCTAYFTTP